MSLTYFVDACLDGEDFVGPLRSAGIDVQPYHLVFPERLDDDQWIPRVAEEGWVAVTGDIGTRWKPVEKRAIIETRLRVLHLARRNSPPHRMLAANFVNSLRKIEDFFTAHEGPVVAQLRRPNRIEDFAEGKPGFVEARQLRLPPGW